MVSNRFLNGIAEAATFASILSILMVLYPERVSMVVATTECMLGLGYALGEEDNKLFLKSDYLFIHIHS